MKKTMKVKKITLNKESLLRLDRDQLAEPVGGISVALACTDSACPHTCIC